MFNRIPKERINWVTSSFLFSTALIAVTAVPWYIWHYGLDSYLIILFFIYFIATGLSITLGYHRLFSHLSFKAKWPVKLFTLIFGAASFENSAIDWACNHRDHHKYVDDDEDPYNINKGFFYAHIGWLLIKLKPEQDRRNVVDLQRDPLVAWQDKYCHWIGFLVGFIVPTLLGYFHSGAIGALGGFLIPGVARLVFVQHMTFFINSLCHTLGDRPYSSECTARDSMLMAFFTFGEGYHNYHHTFQHDYRNGVKPWQFDPTKWAIWLLSKVGLVSGLRRVSAEKILLAEIEEMQRKASRIAENASAVKATACAQEAFEVALHSFKQGYQELENYSKQLKNMVSEQVKLSRKRLRLLTGDIHELGKRMELNARTLKQFA